jgi:hypothetical protein
MEKALIQALKDEKNDLRYYVLRSSDLEKIINTYKPEDFNHNICSKFTEQQRLQIMADRMLSTYVKGEK